MFLDFEEGAIGGEQCNLGSITPDQLGNTLSQDPANQNVRIENDHLNATHPSQRGSADLAAQRSAAFRQTPRKYRGLQTAEVRATWLQSKILDLVTQERVHTTDLWPSTVSLADGLERVAKTRNAFFHEASINDHQACVKDSARLQAIVERGILKLLGWQDDNFHPDAFRTDWLRRGAK